MATCSQLQASSHGEERDNFFQLLLLLYRDGNEKLRQFFKSRWLVVYQNKTGTTSPSPWTDKAKDAKKVKKSLKLHFKEQKKKFYSGNTQIWDFTLLTTVLTKSTLNFVTPSSPESAAIEDLKEIRNILLCHAADAKIPTVVFNTEWTKACNALKVFGLTQKEIDQVIEDIKKPIDVLIPLLKEILKFESEILSAIKNLYERHEVQHRKIISTIERGFSKVTKLFNRPKKCSTAVYKLKITEEQSALLDSRLKYFNDVTATDLLDLLPCLSQEQKDQITYNASNCERQTALKTLIDIIKTCENGFEMLLHALIQAGLPHVAVLLDPDCAEHRSRAEAKVSSFVSYYGETVADIIIPTRIVDFKTGLQKTDIETKIALRYKLSSSENSKELRMAFEEVLPRGVHFVHTRKIKLVDNTRKNGTLHCGSVVFVFRISQERAINEMMKMHENKTLSEYTKEFLDLKSLAADANYLDLEMFYNESDYKQIRKEFLSEEGAAVDPNRDQSETVSIREVYLDEPNQKESNSCDKAKDLDTPTLKAHFEVLENLGSTLASLVENVETALREMPRIMVDFSTIMQSIYVIKAAGSNSESVVEFEELQDGIKNDAMVYLHQHLPLLEELVPSIRKVFEVYINKSFEQWLNDLLFMVQQVHGYRQICESAGEKHTSMLTPLKQREDQAKFVIKTSKELQRQCEERIKEQQTAASTSSTWTSYFIDIAFYPFTLLYTDRELPDLAAFSEQASNLEKTASAVASKLVPTLQNFNERLTCVSSLLKNMEKYINEVNKAKQESMNENIQSLAKSHYMMVMKKAPNIKSHCQTLMFALENVRKTLGIFTTED